MYLHARAAHTAHRVTAHVPPRPACHRSESGSESGQASAQGLSHYHNEYAFFFENGTGKRGASRTRRDADGRRNFFWSFWMLRLKRRALHRCTFQKTRPRTRVHTQAELLDPGTYVFIHVFATPSAIPQPLHCRVSLPVRTHVPHRACIGHRVTPSTQRNSLNGALLSCRAGGRYQTRASYALLGGASSCWASASTIERAPRTQRSTNLDPANLLGVGHRCGV